MNITATSVELRSRSIELAGNLTIEQVQLSCPMLRVELPLDTGAVAGEVTLTMSASEAELNKVLAGLSEGGLRDAEIALLSGRVRVSGRYEVMGPLAVPFTLVAVPEIVGGKRLRLEPRDLSVVGATLPGFSAQVIGERINSHLAKVLNVERSGLPLELTSIVVETGRITLTGKADIEWRRGETGVERSR